MTSVLLHLQLPAQGRVLDQHSCSDRCHGSRQSRHISLYVTQRVNSVSFLLRSCYLTCKATPYPSPKVWSSLSPSHSLLPPGMQCSFQASSVAMTLPLAQRRSMVYHRPSLSCSSSNRTPRARNQDPALHFVDEWHCLVHSLTPTLDIPALFATAFAFLKVGKLP